MHQETKEMLMQLNRWNLVRLIHLHTFNRASDLKWNGNYKNMSTEEVQELLILKELENTGLDHTLKILEDKTMKCDNCPHIASKELIDEAFSLVQTLMAEHSRLCLQENRYKMLRDYIMNNSPYEDVKLLIKDIEGRLL